MGTVYLKRLECHETQGYLNSRVSQTHPKNVRRQILKVFLVRTISVIFRYHLRSLFNLLFTTFSVSFNNTPEATIGNCSFLWTFKKFNFLKVSKISTRVNNVPACFRRLSINQVEKILNHRFYWLLTNSSFNMLFNCTLREENLQFGVKRKPIVRDYEIKVPAAFHSNSFFGS